MHRLRWLYVVLLVAALPLIVNAAKQTSTVPAAVTTAKKLLSGDAMKAHDRFLASDLLEGRGPGTRGGQLAINYIAAQLEALGLEPAGDNGTYLQRVPLIGVTTDSARTSLSFTKPGAAAIGPLTYLDEFVGNNLAQHENDTLDSEVVFVGHGVVAPEYRWDDYKDLDTRGKTLVMLVNDPPANASEPDLFKGKARTYYGRWTYKYEIGATKNADAVILIHTTDAAGYGWEVVRNSWGKEGSHVKVKPNQPALKMAGWMTQQTAANLFRNAGQDLDALMRAAASRDFKPVSLGYRLSGQLVSTLRPFDDANVVAKMTGSDPKLRDQVILYSAHHDHLGIGKPDPDGDAIYNGAIDNASGSAMLIELARVWANTKPVPKRSIYFAFVAAEEQGLLGSAFLGQNPPVPAGRVALALNFDAIPQLGRVRDIVMNGVERTTFYPAAQRITKAMGLSIIPDPQPEQGHYYRSDHFSLGKVGIPAFSVDSGDNYVGKARDWGAKQSDDYREKRYHQPNDEFDENWDWSQGVQMAELGFWLGWEAANAPGMPNWNTGDEFRGIRDKSLGN
jgi:Zn-dependent M28 family amino/carboxypeptidase